MVELRPFIQTIKQLCEVGAATQFEADTLLCGAAQIEQVLINLIKKAKQSGSISGEILLSVYQITEQITFEVTNQDKGITEQQLLQALLPFYTTKP